MSDDNLQKDALLKALQHIETPATDQTVKQQTIQCASAAFQAHQQEKSAEKTRQGFWQRIRLTFTVNKTDRGKGMSYHKRMLFAAIPSACVVLITAGLVFQHLISPEMHVTEESAMQLDYIQAQPEKERAKKEERSPLPKSLAKPSVQLDTRIANPATPPTSYEIKQDAQREEAIITGTQIRANESSAQAIAGNDNESQTYYKETGRNRFEDFKTNPVKRVREEPVSTFSIDVDTAAYSFVRRQLNRGLLPQKDAVRIEEMINYFDYNYPLAKNKNQPFQPFVAISNSPWAKDRKLLHIGIKGYAIAPEEKPRSNLVFLLDVSGSMDSPDKLPLVKQSMQLLLSRLNPTDTIAIAVYAGAAGTVLEPTQVKHKQKILSALQHLSAGGSTSGSEGIRLAYQLAETHFDKNAVNRIILATDGDFNVGITNREELQDFVERKREKGIFLSVLGFGEGNYHDHMMQTLAQHGNGVAAYIDTLSEAQKVLVDEASSTLFPIAKDVKIQLEFNPKTVAEYRLIGYETRHLNREDFSNDAVDAGDIGAGHTVTALYEITLADANVKQIDDNRYAQTTDTSTRNKEQDNEYAFLKIRYKLPDSQQSLLLTQAIGKQDDLTSSKQKHPAWMTQETGFATAVAGFAQLLRGGQYMGEYNYDDVITLAQQTKGNDEYGYRNEFIQLVRKAKIADAM